MNWINSKWRKIDVESIEFNDKCQRIEQKRFFEGFVLEGLILKEPLGCREMLLEPVFLVSSPKKAAEKSNKYIYLE